MHSPLSEWFFYVGPQQLGNLVFFTRPTGVGFRWVYDIIYLQSDGWDIYVFWSCHRWRNNVGSPTIHPTSFKVKTYTQKKDNTVYSFFCPRLPTWTVHGDCKTLSVQIWCLSVGCLGHNGIISLDRCKQNNWIQLDGIIYVYIYGSVSKPCTPGEHQNSW